MVAFVDLMNAKAREFGMTDTTFTNPSGAFDSRNPTVSTSHDLMIMGCKLYDNNKYLVKLTQQKEQDIQIEGPNKRTLKAVSTVQNTSWFNSFYKILFGKTGSWSASNLRQKNLFIIAERRKKTTAIVLLKSYFPNVFCSMLGALLFAVPILEKLIPAKYVSYCCVYNTLNFNNIKRGGGKRQYEKTNPLSITKLMTSAIVLDYLSPEDLLIVKKEDIVSTTGIKFQEGDKLSIHNALVEMLLSSNNTLANALSRIVEELLN